MDTTAQLLSLKDVKISFDTENGTFKAVKGISFDLNKGEVLGIVGESGSGKSVTSLAILGLLNKKKSHIEGQITYFKDGQPIDLTQLTEEGFKKERGNNFSMI